MVSVTLCVEGGANSRQQRELKRAFKAFFEKANVQVRLLRVLPRGSRENAYKFFCATLKRAGDDDFVVLRVDAEISVNPDVTSWDHLRGEDGWARPAGVDDDQAHLMVQCMEAWFLADRKCLETYFGRDFNTRALPRRSDVEAIPKKDLFASLKNATRNTAKRGYDKGADSFKILEMLDPELVCNASPHACRLIDVLRQKL